MFDLCIPTKNESEIIAKSLQTLRDTLQSLLFEWQIIVADNGSSDNTLGIVKGLHFLNVRSVSIPGSGKGNAITTIARESTSDIFGFIDADLSADPKHIVEFVNLITEGKIDIAIGSRLIDQHFVKRSFLRTLSSQIFNLIRRIILGIRVQDSQCGLKVMNVRGRNILAQCNEKGWFLDLEFLLRAEKSGLVIQEVPINWVEHRITNRKGRLRLISDGWGALIAMIRIRRSMETDKTMFQHKDI